MYTSQKDQTYTKGAVKQPVRLESFIQQHAHKDAQAIFAEHQQDQTVREESERVRSLAQFEVSQFYQHGFVLLFLKASLLGYKRYYKRGSSSHEVSLLVYKLLHYAKGFSSSGDNLLKIAELLHSFSPTR